MKKRIPTLLATMIGAALYSQQGLAADLASQCMLGVPSYDRPLVQGDTNSLPVTITAAIARNIAAQSNANKQAMLDDMTTSFNAIAVGRNVRFENVIRVKKGLPPNKIKEWLDTTRAEITPKSCAQNANNPALERGLSYTFAYSNTYGEKLGDVFVDKATCKNIGL